MQAAFARYGWRMQQHLCPLFPLGEQQDLAHYGVALGGESHPRVYGSLLVSILIFVMASWLAFGRDGETDYLLMIVGFIFAAFAALPTLIFLAGRSEARADGERKPMTIDEFVNDRIATGSGLLTGRQAWLQIAVIPLSLALAAISIGLASVFAV
jgi:hypothetical protein